MSKNLVLGIVAAVIVLLAGGFYLLSNRDSGLVSPSPEPMPVPPVSTNLKTVHMTDTEYIPASLTINQNDTITFINRGSNNHWPASALHPTHQVYPEFDPKAPIKPGDSWSFTFTKVGVWRWHDHLYPTINGTITVTQQ